MSKAMEEEVKVVSEQDRQARRDAFKAQTELYKQVAATVQANPFFYFPLDMVSNPGRDYSPPHQFAGLLGQFKEFELLNNQWFVIVEAKYTNGRRQRQHFGLKRFARLIGMLNDGPC